jgi:hypothetical protein
VRKFWDGLAGIVLVLWIGGIWATGYLVAPSLFGALPGDKQLAGNLAGVMFERMAWVGMVAGSYLLLHRLVRHGTGALKAAFFWLVATMLVLTLIGQYGVTPILQSLKDQALPLAVMESVFADRFRTWHGVSSILSLITSLLGAALVWRSGLAR